MLGYTSILGYISSTRKKSCPTCFQAKRRCDLGYPACRRLFLKDLECNYPSAASASSQPRAREEHEVVVRQTAPDWIPFIRDNVISDPLPTSTALVTVGANFRSALISEDTNLDDESPERIERSEVCTSLAEAILPQIWEPRIVDQYQTTSALTELCTFIPTLASEGRTPFLHGRLYKTWKPTAYQDSIYLSTLYVAKTKRNMKLLASLINNKISGLISTSKGWALTEHLAAVQAMIIYQTIRLFDPTLNQQFIGHRQNALLELWTATLWKRSFIESTPFPESSHQSWIFQESLRRTVLMSIFLRSIWSCITNNGVCDLVPTLARLPVARDMKLWSMDSKEWMKREVNTGEPDGGLVTYGDLSIAWQPVNKIENLDRFERLLVANCRWDEDPATFASSMRAASAT